MTTHRKSIIASMILAAVLCGCSSSDNDPTNAEGAFSSFVQAIRAKDKDAVWNGTASTGKQQFYYAYASLVRMDRIIEAYFDPSEHKYLRKVTGSALLKEVPIRSPKELFDYTFHPENIKIELDEEVGTRIASTDQEADAPWLITINTKGGQQFVMVYEADGHWRNAGLQKVFDAALEPIFSGEAAMKEYAKDNLKAEIERRKEVIDYFLKERLRKEARHNGR